MLSAQSRSGTDVRVLPPLPSQWMYTRMQTSKLAPCSARAQKNGGVGSRLLRMLPRAMLTHSCHSKLHAVPNVFPEEFQSLLSLLCWTLLQAHRRQVEELSQAVTGSAGLARQLGEAQADAAARAAQDGVGHARVMDLQARGPCHPTPVSVIHQTSSISFAGTIYACCRGPCKTRLRAYRCALRYCA